MSPYMIDKFMRTLQMDRSALKRFDEDPEASIAEWVSVTESLPVSGDGGSLTEEAQQAFAELDLAALYAMGAHPYMLWHFFVDVMTLRGKDRPETIEMYRSAIAEAGYPSFAT
jgi:hypothetical protein